jgi:hypothetical protein
MLTRRSLWLLTLLIAGAGDALATGCQLAAQGTGRIETIIDPVTIRLEDGREVRLAGLARLDIRRDQDAAALARLVLGREVTLHGDSDTPDRNGRQPALVYRSGDEVSLQALLLSLGRSSGSRLSRRTGRCRNPGARRPYWFLGGPVRHKKP